MEQHINAMWNNIPKNGKISHEPSAPTTARKSHFFIASYYMAFIVNMH
jgi:hypothetical protein